MLAKTYSPIDNALVFEQPYADQASISAALKKSRMAQRQWAEFSLVEKAHVCRKAIDYFIDNKATIGQQITQQMGRPIAYSPNEVNGLAERANGMIDLAPEALADTVIEDNSHKRRLIRKHPLGTLLIIAPWNYPLLTTANSVFAGLMTGNSIILKPSIQTPLVAEHFVNSFGAAGAPKDLIQALCLDHNQTEQLLHQGDIDYCCFTGSVTAGKTVEKALAGRFKRLTLELGGKDAAYVRADADIEKAVRHLVDGAFFNSGQSCCGIERIYVAKPLFKPFVDAYVSEVYRYQMGNPLDPAVTLGPLVNAKAADWVRQQNEQAIKAGATACIDSQHFTPTNDQGAYLTPQVLIDVNHSMNVMREESFGPTVGIMPVSNDNEAVQLMNDSQYGLTASLWSQDRRQVEQLGNRIEAGTIFMNRCDYLDPSLVWTGVKDTGKGASLSTFGYQSLVQLKSFLLEN